MRRTWLILATLYTIVFLNSFGYFLIIPVLVEVLTNPAHSMISTHLTQLWGDYLFSIVLGAGSIAGLAFGPLLGRISDQIGRRKILIVCTILTLISFILPVLALLDASITLLMLGNIINGISSNNQPIAQAAISDISQKQTKKARRFSIDTCVITAAMTLGPIAGTYLSDTHLVSWFNQTTPFLAAGLLTLLSLILLLCLFPETNPNAPEKLQISFRRGWRTFSDVFSLSPSTKRLLLVFFLAQTAWAQYFQYSYLYLVQTLDFSQRDLSLFTASIGAWISFGLLVIYPFWIKKLSLRSGATFCFFVCFVSMLIMGLSSAHWVQWTFVVPLALGIGMYFPSLLTLFSAQADKQQGWIMAVASALLGLAWFITGFSSIYLSYKNPQLPLTSAAGLLLISFIVMRYDNGKAR